MKDDPKLPEPVAYVDDLSRPQPHCVTSLKYCSVLQHQRGDHLRYTPVITTAAAQAYAEALAAARVAQERERCVAWIEARKDAFCDAHGYIDPDTGFLEFGRGAHAQAKHEYVSELEEIADGLRALSTQPPETGRGQR